ncbi:MAG: 50S ribosomal protein L24 [Candidatus Vogelbacteria bacterium GWA1_51_14]|uniref:Large ribosomal subunit protein uL24 n=1 Tax=Candidatus Vogelbacteria bacterium GWA1_51_14 TaxID=1802435 RepID=A0A1G2Q8D4_9BACT|nr:MAG: 50S ribosomal protein L24 [Candidatus Vogelbacteria bacterium GWA1_51_14]
MTKVKIKKGDKVGLIAGKDRGKSGKVLRVLREENRVIVEGLNLRSRRIKPRRSGEKGQTVSKPNPVHISNVMIWCDKCNRGVRLGTKVTLPAGRQGATKKERICRRCGKAV